MAEGADAGDGLKPKKMVSINWRLSGLSDRDGSSLGNTHANLELNVLCSRCVSGLRIEEPGRQRTDPAPPSPWPQSPEDHTPVEAKQRPWCSANTVFQRAESCSSLPPHLHKHAKEELGAELLDSLGRRLFIVAVRGLFLDFCCGQAELGAAFCTQRGKQSRVKTRREEP